MKTRLLHHKSLAFAFVLLLILLSATAALGQTTSFTYQGRLTDGGTAANGNYDLQFALWDSLSGGNQVGSTQMLNTVAVDNGVFTVSLDFGANAFPGASRFLEISARPSGSGSFTLLTPRQPITSTPYAVRSLNASTADSVPASGVRAGSGNYIQNSTTPQATSNFNISGNGTAGGTLSGGVVNATTQYNLNGSRLISAPGEANNFFGASAGSSNTTGFGNNFFGRSAGSRNTTGRFNDFFGDRAGFSNTTGSFNSFFGGSAGVNNTTGDSNNFFGSSAGSSNTTGSGNAFFGSRAGGGTTTGSHNAFFGPSAGSVNDTGRLNTFVGASAGLFGPSDLVNASAIGACAFVNQSNSLVLGTPGCNLDGVTIGPTNVGIGTNAPTARLSVVATGDGARVLHLGIERAWVFKQFGTGAATALELTGDDANNNNKHFVINTQGNVGIGTQGPLDRLHVIGDIRVGVFGTNGCLKNNNGGTIAGTCSSDLRFKRDLVPFAPVLNKVTRLQPTYYFWRAKDFPQNNFGASREAGLVAQEVEQVLPELVGEDERGFKTVDYSKLPLLLLQAIKEQQAQIKTQQQQIAVLTRFVCQRNPPAQVCNKKGGRR